jgi:hypothetical protein
MDQHKAVAGRGCVKIPEGIAGDPLSGPPILASVYEW